jgi:hypothetical protein
MGLYCSGPGPEDGNIQFQNISVLFRMAENGQVTKSSNNNCNILSSELFRVDLLYLL